MTFNFKTIAASALAFVTLGNCHMIMAKPVPYGVSTLNNSPLNNVATSDPTSDFPCKQRPGVYDITTMNHIEVGTPQELSFIGSASHGGGTCQLAITKDKQPTAQSTFKVFQVFEGGCPVSSNGNTGSHPFTFELPKDMPNGVMTFAWIWYNRIGNRELYMNCAPVTITGGSSSDTFFNSLPNAYIINLPTSECQSTQDFASNAVTIPHPGQFIMKDTVGQEMAAASGPGCAAAASKMLEGVTGYKSTIVQNGASYQFAGAGGSSPSGTPPGPPSGAPSGSAAAPSGQASAAPSGFAAAPSGSAPAASGSAAPSGFASAPASGAVPAPSGAPSSPSGSAAPFGSAAPSAQAGSAAPSGSVAPSAPVGSAAPFASAAPSAPVGSAAPSGFASGSAPAPSGAASAAPVPSGASCSSTSSAMSCSSDGKQFGVCSEGKMIWRAVAPGTTCSNGEIQKREDVVNRHVRRHLLRAGRRGI